MRKDRFGLAPLFGKSTKGRTKRYNYGSRFKSAQMVLQEMQDKIDKALKSGPCVKVPITDELREKYLQRK